MLATDLQLDASHQTLINGGALVSQYPFGQVLESSSSQGVLVTSGSAAWHQPLASKGSSTSLSNLLQCNGARNLEEAPEKCRNFQLKQKTIAMVSQTNQATSQRQQQLASPGPASDLKKAGDAPERSPRGGDIRRSNGVLPRTPAAVLPPSPPRASRVTAEAEQVALHASSDPPVANPDLECQGSGTCEADHLEKLEASAQIQSLAADRTLQAPIQKLEESGQGGGEAAVTPAGLAFWGGVRSASATPLRPSNQLRHERQANSSSSLWSNYELNEATVSRLEAAWGEAASIRGSSPAASGHLAPESPPRPQYRSSSASAHLLRRDYTVLLKPGGSAVSGEGTLLLRSGGSTGSGEGADSAGGGANAKAPSIVRGEALTATRAASGTASSSVPASLTRLLPTSSSPHTILSSPARYSGRPPLPSRQQQQQQQPTPSPSPRQSCRSALLISPSASSLVPLGPASSRSPRVDIGDPSASSSPRAPSQGKPGGSDTLRNRADSLLISPGAMINPALASPQLSPKVKPSGLRPSSPSFSGLSARSSASASTISWAPRPLHPAAIVDSELLEIRPRNTVPSSNSSQNGTRAQRMEEVQALGEDSSPPLDAKGRPYPYVLPPCFPGAYPSIAFSDPAKVKHLNGLHPLVRVNMNVRFAGIANGPVRHAFKEAGFRIVKGSKWNVCWGNILDADAFSALHEFQRVNHFPGTWELGNKGNLYRNVYNLRRLRGEALDVIPRFFLLPRDYDEFKNDYERSPKRLYIQKPTNSSRGRGVRMLATPKDISRDTRDVLIQHYVDRPMLINRLKFDMRIYVAATCLDPLRLYVFEDGLARFATEEYSEDKSDLTNRCVHLTNVSVNKKSKKFIANASTEDESSGSKWSLKALRNCVEVEGKVTWKHIWQQVHDISAKAILAAEPRMNTESKMKVPHRNNCFEVWGLDIMLDADFRAWLIEVNTCPSLAADSPLDKRIKNTMVADIMNLVGVIPYEADVYAKAEEAKRRARLTGLVTTASGGSGRVSGGSEPPLGALGGSKGERCDRPGSRTGVRVKQQQGCGAGEIAMVPKTVKEAEEMDFTGVSPELLPEVITELEAEYQRRRGWERVFPCVEDPERYLDLFETPRASNVMVCNYLLKKSGRGKRPAGSSSRSVKLVSPWS